mmetsp:Transcript_20963/g.53098  ORF Transcript_20963/g.53098 Transcript_20963/m.53098 type:complete len:188 (-) Transcript_20963:277-840(-)
MGSSLPPPFRVAWLAADVPSSPFFVLSFFRSFILSFFPSFLRSFSPACLVWTSAGKVCTHVALSSFSLTASLTSLRQTVSYGSSCESFHCLQHFLSALADCIRIVASGVLAECSRIAASGAQPHHSESVLLYRSATRTDGGLLSLNQLVNALRLAKEARDFGLYVRLWASTNRSSELLTVLVNISKN